MSETKDSKSRRDLITRLVPYLAASVIKVGVFSSPLSALTAAATKYNEEIDKTKEKVVDLLPLLPGVEKLQMEVVGTGTVSLVLHRRDLRGCAEQYLGKVFKLEGADGASAGPPRDVGEESKFDYVLRLPFKNIYMKLVRLLTYQQAAELRETARKLNPGEVWVFSDQGGTYDEKLEPVFVSESMTLRGRFRSMATADMLSGLFEGKFAVALEPATEDSAKVLLRLRS